MPPQSLQPIPWRQLFPGAERSMIEWGIDPEQVLELSSEEGYEVVGRTLRSTDGLGPQDVEVFYRRLRVKHRVIDEYEENRYLVARPRIITTVIP